MGEIGHACNPSTWAVEEEDQWFKVVLSYTSSLGPLWDRLCVKTTKQNDISPPQKKQQQKNLTV